MSIVDGQWRSSHIVSIRTNRVLKKHMSCYRKATVVMSRMDALDCPHGFTIYVHVHIYIFRYIYVYIYIYTICIDVYIPSGYYQFTNGLMVTHALTHMMSVYTLLVPMSKRRLNKSSKEHNKTV